MKFKLFYKDLEIASVKQVSQDFPNLSGTYTLIATNSEDSLIIQYINYSIQASILMEENTEKWEAFMEQEEHRYNQLIESQDWVLEAENKDKQNIIIPVFCYNNEIVWRWKLQ